MAICKRACKNCRHAVKREKPKKGWNFRCSMGETPNASVRDNHTCDKHMTDEEWEKWLDDSL